jgi:phosphohistidine phosphatase SixA
MDPNYLWDEPTRADNSYHVVTGSGTDETAILDGFNITAGNADGERDTPISRGAGLYNVSGRPSITNCKFGRNSASEGCGIYNSGSNPTLANCIFVLNEAEHSGGGIYNDNSNPNLTHCNFYGNIAFYGGGMANHESSPILINCEFNGNMVLMIVWPDGDSMGGDGGGIHNINSNPTLSDCKFINNLAWQGAGMDNSQSNPILTRSKFSGNFSVEHGGGMSNSLSRPTLTNSIFSGNMAVQYGGGMDNSESNPSLINCTFSDNSADSGGGIGNFKSAPTLTNCILWGNTAFGGEQIELIDPPSSVSISYSNLQGGQAAVYDPCEALVWGAGNTDLDPFFVKSGYWADINNPNIIVEPFDPNAIWIDGDYHLKSEAGRWDSDGETWFIDDVTSPCIDTGDPTSDWSAELWPHGTRANMGAYGGTFQASRSLSDVGNIADLNRDGIVDSADMSIMVDYWLTDEPVYDIAPPPFGDGIVDIQDLIILAEHLFEEPAQRSQVTTVVIVRHAERSNGTLTEIGEKRAETLARLLSKVGVTAIFSTNYTRTIETANNTAERLGIPILFYTSIEGVADLIKSEYTGKVVLVVGHSNTVTQTVEALGVSSVPQFDGRYDNLYIVTIGPDSIALLTHLRFDIHPDL